ncbi:TolB family protein [Maribellus mangrovi]|uniref:TolB family protein n=1 Tax=Maribellus mangrovi TaxID=3133146 RepID=UPI0030EC348C
MKNKLLTYFTYCSIILAVLVSCNREPENVEQSDNYPNIYPDYINVTIPMNIAPLNFMLRDSVENVVAEIKSVSEMLLVKGKQKIRIPEKKWKDLLLKGEQTLEISVTANHNGRWTRYKTFTWEVKNESIDGYLSYRLIEPGYEVWNKIQLAERNIESFDERILADNNLTENSCMNCHIYGNQDPNLSMFHLRGAKGGTVLNRNGELRKINTRNKEMIANATYGNLHPSGRYGVFSSNVVIPEFHTYKSERLEVYDRASDLIVVDFDNNKVSTRPFLSDTTTFETFPVFSADGKSIFYCSAPYKPVPDSIRSMRYSIHRIAFYPKTGELGTKPDTIWDAEKHKGSVSHLKTSPDGKYLLYTVADYGTFPIWHREAELQMINLKNGNVDKLEAVNGPNSDTYHSWSSNSRWFVFASKRDNGIYGKPYFAYVDAEGKVHEPFVLPQKDPATYDFMLKSFNIPELAKGPVPFDAMDIEKLYFEQEAEVVH